MSPAYREVGIAATPESNPATEVGPLVITQDFGARFAQTQPFLLGVVYADANSNAFYNNGEGLGGITVTAVGPGGTHTTTTFASGGYQMNLPPGAYTVTFSGGGLPAPRTRTIAVGSQNAKLDLNTLAGDPASSFVQFATTVVTVGEGTEQAITVLRAGDTSEAVAIPIFIGPGTTAALRHYELTPNDGFIHFDAGQTIATLFVRALGDDVVESTRVLVVGLSPAPGSGVGVGTNGRLTVMIPDDDRLPVTPVTLVDARAAGGGRGARTVALRLSGDVDARSVARPNAFIIRRAGRDRRLDTADDARIRVARVRYNASTKVVTLHLAGVLRRNEPTLLIVRPALLRDLSGAPLSGGTSLVVSMLRASARRGA